MAATKTNGQQTAADKYTQAIAKLEKLEAENARLAAERDAFEASAKAKSASKPVYAEASFSEWTDKKTGKLQGGEFVTLYGDWYPLRISIVKFERIDEHRAIMSEAIDAYRNGN